MAEKRWLIAQCIVVGMDKHSFLTHTMPGKENPDGTWKYVERFLKALVSADGNDDGITFDFRPQ